MTGLRQKHHLSARAGVPRPGTGASAANRAGAGACSKHGEDTDYDNAAKQACSSLKRDCLCPALRRESWIFRSRMRRV